MKPIVVALLLGLLLAACASNERRPENYGGESEYQRQCQIQSSGWSARSTNCYAYE